jgi:hypothetical protein
MTRRFQEKIVHSSAEFGKSHSMNALHKGIVIFFFGSGPENTSEDKKVQPTVSHL